MKLLVLCQHYYPEPFRITDICEELVKMGHAVTVVCGAPNYPMGEIYPGYEKGKRADEIVNGVTVHRCNTAPRKTGVLNRVRNYFSYPRVSKKYIKKLPGDFDVVLVNQLSPVMMAEAGILYKKMHNKKLVLYSLDLWPESLCVGGIKKGSAVYNVFKKISERIYRSADRLLITSRMFRQYFKDQFGIPDERIAYLPQYAEEQFLGLGQKEPGEVFHLLFAGNIGAAQSIDTIIDAAMLLRDEKVCFDIVGDGIELERLQKKAAGLENVVFHGRKPLCEMPAYYDMADAMLVTLLDDPVISMTLPGKVQTYMAAGKPIVGAIGGETALVLREAQGGYCGPSGDAAALAENITRLIASGKAPEIGQRNRQYYHDAFAKEKFMRDLMSYLTDASAQ